MDQNIFNKRNEILNNISKASLKEVSQILEHYKPAKVLENGTVNLQPITIGDITYQLKYSPIKAASLNARYHELTGHDYPGFIEEQKKVLDQLLSHKKELAKNGFLTIQIDTLERLRKSLDKKESISIISSTHPILNLRNTIFDLSKVSLNDISQILDCYKSSQVLDCGKTNMEPLIVDGVTYHMKYNPQEAATLNARYHELTGQDHPVFLEEQAKALDLLLSHKQELAKYGYPTTYVETLERLKKDLKQQEPSIEIVAGKKDHILRRTNEILENVKEAKLEDVTSLLNYYNGQPVIIDGIAYHTFNDPLSAYKLNIRYHELTGQDHPNYVKQVPKVIDGLMKDKDTLIQLGAYSPEYFEALEQIRNPSVNESDKPKQR